MMNYKRASSRGRVKWWNWSAVVSVLIASSAATQGSAHSFAQTCEGFKPANVATGAEIRSITAEPAANGSTAHCVVRGSITTSPRSVINFRVDLPETAAWNSQLLHIGGGGFDGLVPTDTPMFKGMLTGMLGPDAPQLAAFVVVSSDSGHQGRGAVPWSDFSWAANNPDAIANHADRANHLVLWSAVNLAKSFYGREPEHRYMFGGSNGGRQGLVAAQRHPQDYHGIMAMVPAISQEGFAANLTALFQHIYSRPENWLGKEARELFVRAQTAACDGLDGLEDGIIGNYRACKFDPGQIVCPPGEASDPQRCLTPGQAESIRMTHASKRVDVPLADGFSGYPGHGLGSDANEWSFIFGSSFEARDGVDFFLADNIVKVITNDPNASIVTHDPTQWRDAYLALSKQIDATDPDLSAFAANGGKLIIWYGVGDLCVSIERTAEYIRAVEQRLGKDTTRSFLRFYASPSLGHGLTGTGANYAPLFSTLQQWVEKGHAPKQLIAARRDAAGATAFTRPLCEYGSYPRYKGKGDTHKAGSFACEAF